MKVDELAVKRCVQHLASVKRVYPEAWKLVDNFRAIRGKDIPDWPRWCYLPLSAAYAIVSGGSDRTLTPNEGASIAVVGAMAAWRPAKAIYQFDSSVFAELWDTPVAGNIPTDVLERMPAWCCYIPFPEPREVLGTQRVYGFFVHLEHDSGCGRRELRLLLDMDVEDRLHLTAFPLHLVGGDLQSCVAAMCTEVHRQQIIRTGVMEDNPDLVDQVLGRLRNEGAAMIAPLVSLVLYLCSTTAEIRPRDPMRGMRCKPAKTKHGRRDFGPDQPVMWEVAYRLGATLRAAAEAPRSSGSGDGGHASPRAHIRRAHWHSFWTGPKAKPGKIVEGTRELILHWIPPTPVMVGEDGVIPTVHRVTV